MNKTNAALSKNTRALLKLLNIKNKTALAKKTGSHHKTIYDIHDNKGNPTLAILDLVASKLNIPTWLLLQDIFNIEDIDIKLLLEFLKKLSTLTNTEIVILLNEADKLSKYKKVRETLAIYEPKNPLTKLD